MDGDRPDQKDEQLLERLLLGRAGNAAEGVSAEASSAPQRPA
jgi:hypothetical protein